MQEKRMNRLFTIFFVLIVFGCQQTKDKDYEVNPNGLFPIKEYGKWGFINSEGKTVIECNYDDALPFSEGLAPVLLDTLWGFIDTLGILVIKPDYKSIHGFSDGLALSTIYKDSKYYHRFINKNGKTVLQTEYKRQDNFNSGLALVKKDDEICFIDKDGEIVINTGYPYGSGFSGGIAHLWSGSHTKYIDTNGQEIFSYSGRGHGDFSEGFAHINDNDSDFYINRKGQIAIKLPKSGKQYREFSNGLAEVYDFDDTRLSSFIDTTGKEIMPFKYSIISDFNEGLAPFIDSLSLIGFINKKGEVEIKSQYEDVDFKGYRDGLCRVKKDRQWGYINHSGEFVWKSQRDLQYENLNLAKWQLDTLEIKAPIYGEKYAGTDNKSRIIDFINKTQYYLKADTADITVYADKYFGYKVYFVNGTNDTIYIPAQDGRIKLIQQALNEKNEWQDIENFINSWCGNSYHSIQILPNHYQIYTAPITKGDIKTSLRFRLELRDTVIHSNEYNGAIHKEQFLNPEEKDKTGIAVWTN